MPVNFPPKKNNCIENPIEKIRLTRDVAQPGLLAGHFVPLKVLFIGNWALFKIHMVNKNYLLLLYHR